MRRWIDCTLRRGLGLEFELAVWRCHTCVVSTSSYFTQDRLCHATTILTQLPMNPLNPKLGTSNLELQTRKPEPNKPASPTFFLVPGSAGSCFQPAAAVSSWCLLVSYSFRLYLLVVCWEQGNIIPIEPLYIYNLFPYSLVTTSKFRVTLGLFRQRLFYINL